MTEQQHPDDLRTPWSFKVMVVLVVLYLGWRLIEAVVWLWQRVF